MEGLKFGIVVLMLVTIFYMLIASIAYQMKAYGENKYAGLLLLLWWTLFTFGFYGFMRILWARWL